MTKLTTKQIIEMAELREQGWSYLRLSKQFGVSLGAIHYQCLKNGAISPRQRRHPSPIEPEAVQTSQGRLLRRFTQSEDQRLLELEAEGLSCDAIAARIGRPRTSVRIRLLRLALQEDMPA